MDRRHAISYALVDLLPHGHYHQHEPEIHGYVGAPKLAGGFGLALRAFFRRSSFGAWLHEGGISGIQKQITPAAALLASVLALAPGIFAATDLLTSLPPAHSFSP